MNFVSAVLQAARTTLVCDATRRFEIPGLSQRTKRKRPLLMIVDRANRSGKQVVTISAFGNHGERTSIYLLTLR
jgi:hypothetical protein